MIIMINLCTRRMIHCLAARVSQDGTAILILAYKVFAVAY